MAAKEMLIVFLYDTEICTKEEDDPMEALLFFAPSWVGETQKLALVGQIMGVTRFFQDNFLAPRIITLQSGKFALRLLSLVGTDRNVAESILKHRSELLANLLQLYHNDIEKISGLFSLNNMEQRKNFTEKLYHIFDTYIPILQYNGNIFHNIVLLDLPKSAADIYLETVQILQSCQQQGVLGGQILYHNKVIASQLAPDLAKLLVISDPLRLKTVDTISVGFHVPFGVQLMTVYISSKDFNNLQKSAHKAQNSFTNNNPNLLPFTLKKKSIVKENVVSGMKRDKSLIFTNIPEEESASEPHDSNVKSKSRPTNLPLKFKNMASKELPESGFSSINFDEFSDSFPDFIGRTSVCSTPMTENKILHGNILSICSNTCEELERVDLKIEDKPPLSIISSEPITNGQKTKKSRKIMGTPRKLKLTPKVTEVISVDVDLKEEEQRSNNKPYPNDVNLPIDSCNYMHNPYKVHRRRNSWDALSKIGTKLKFVKNSNNQKPKSLTKKESQDVDWDSETEFIDDCEIKPSRSITDPTFPVFNAVGDPISKYLFEEFLVFHYTHICADNTEDSQKKLPKGLNFWESENKNNKPNKVGNTENVPDQTIPKDGPKLNKQALSLPLKSWNQTSESGSENDKKSFNIFEPPSKRNRGLQLTPLMAKLTILAMDGERNSGFEANYDLTPGAIDPQLLLTKRRLSQTKTDTNETLQVCDHFEKVDLFVCAQQNMTLLILLENGAAQKQKLIQTLFEVCVSKLTKIEAQLHQILNMNVEGADKGGEGCYSFIAIDNKKWDMVKKSGPWSPNELSTVELMHSDMKRQENLTDMILRKDENILYGYQCGNVEVFYQQSHNAPAGLVPPSDVFGNINSVSRRRLERDHAIILL